MKLTGYFIKDIKQYGEISEKIVRAELSNDKDIEKLKEEREIFLNELIKRYG